MSLCVCVCARSVRDTVVRRVFPHLTEAFQDCDNGPHYQNSAKILTLVDNHERTGIKIVISCSCEPGEGKWFVDAKFSHIKRHHAKNIKYDKGDAVCADSYGRSACKLGGESSSIVAVLDASSMQRELELKTPPGAIKNVSCLRVKIPTADGGLLLYRSWRIGTGIPMTAAAVTSAWKGKQWPEPAPSFVLMGIGDDVAVNAKVKGTFEQERSSRAEKKKTAAARKAEFAAKRADTQAAIAAIFTQAATHVTCNVCLAPIAVGDDADAALQTHAATCSGAALPGRHKFPCVGCGCRGHMTPAAKACTPAAKAEWQTTAPDARQRKLESAKEKWRREYKPRTKLATELKADDLGADYLEERNWTKTVQRARGGIDTVTITVDAVGIADLTLVPPADGAAWPTVTVKPGSATHAELIVRDGYALVAIGDTATTATSLLPELRAGDGRAVELKFSMPSPAALGQGWAMQQPDLTHPPMAPAQALFLYRMLKLPGKLPSDHIHRKMELHFTLRPELIMKPRRVKTWISRVVGAEKKGALTKQVTLVKAALENADGDYDRALAELQARGADAAGEDEKTGSDSDDDDAADADGSAADAAADDDDDDEHEPAPAPRRGFKHAAAAAQQLSVGARLQYWFVDDGGWLACSIHKVVPGRTTTRYDVHCEDEQIYLGMHLRACEHGPAKRWVLWQPDHALAGDAEYAVVDIHSGLQPLPPPELGADMAAYIRERIARRLVSCAPRARHDDGGSRTPHPTPPRPSQNRRLCA